MRTLRLLRSALILTVLACGADVRPASDFDRARFVLEPELRIGSVDDPETALTWVRNLAVAPDGRIYSAHPQELLIRIHDAEGRLLRTVGGRGEGPGEFQRLSGMGLLGDTLWALDYGTYRFTFFDLDGELLGSERVRRATTRGADERALRPVGLLHDGSILAGPSTSATEVTAGTITTEVEIRVRPGGRAAGESGGAGDRRFDLGDTAAAVLDTLAVHSIENTLLGMIDDEAGFASFRGQPFADAEIVRVSRRAPEVVRVDRSVPEDAADATFRVTKYAFDGDTMFSRTFGYSPRPIEPERVDRFLESVRSVFERMQRPGAPTPARGVELAREALYLPDFHRPVGRALLGRDGSTWLLRSPVEGDSARWNVLDPEGEPMGTVVVPRGVGLTVVDATTVWAVERGELDVPYIVRYALREAPADAS